MQYLREWASDEARAKFAQELRAEALVWMKVMVEHSPPAGRADPLAIMRQAFADAVDDQWSGRMFDLSTFGSGSTHSAIRLSCSMLVGPTVRSLLRRPVGGTNSAAFSSPLRQAVGGRMIGPDLVVIIGNPDLTIPKQLPKGAQRSKFLIGTLGGDAGTGLQQLATASGGTAMALRDEGDARFLASLVCKAFLSLAASGEGQVAATTEAAQYFDADANRSGYGHGYISPSGEYETRNYALGENDSPHGLGSLEYREPRRCEGSDPPGGYQRGGYDPYDDDLF
ncbi:MAG: hypothetical protein PGN13_08275 [Patulibacter minatonensis]